MSEFIIENGVVIDEIESVVENIARLSGLDAPDPKTIQKFITGEKATRFYIDNKCSCKMQPDRDTVYLWLDSGFIDQYGHAIMISLLNNGSGMYTGHYCGSMKTLSNSIARFFAHNRKSISRNIGTVISKYNNKIAERVNQHILDEQEYLIKVSNGESADSTMSNIIKGLTIDYNQLKHEDEVVQEEEDEEDVLQVPQMSAFEDQMTIELMWDYIMKQKEYIDKLMGIIEECNLEKARRKELEEENAQYKRALADIRTHMTENNMVEVTTNYESASGHELLGHRGKILVIGDCCLDEKVLNGIAKTYGFKRQDFEYELDYKKVVSNAGRISYGCRYSAIVLGACPHKVNSLGDYSSLIEKCKNDLNLPNAYDARTRSGELKVTKESYRTVLENIIADLRKEKAA